jgi:hypothetical protein
MLEKDNGSRTSRLAVPFTEQQLTLLRKVVEEGSHGASIEDACLSIYREYTRQLFVPEGQ